MRNRFWMAATLTTVSAIAQSSVGPRTADGHPDLSGMYDIATLTPLTRPAFLGDRMSLTDAEAKTLAQSTAARNAKLNEPSDPNRPPPPAGGDGSEGPAGNVGGYNTLWVDSGTGAFKIDGQWRTSIIIDPANGRLPPMTPGAQKVAAGRGKMNRPNRGDAWWMDADGVSPGPYDDPELRPTAERCLLGFGVSAGPPALPVMYNNLKQIVQTKDQVMILNEMVHDVRVVRLNSKHEPAEIRRWLGDSIGHWEGDTLVVDTTNFNDQPALSASRNLHVIERFTRVDSKILRYKFTVEDPTVWNKPWTGEMVWPATDARIYEYACHEGNYSFAGILRGARRLEAEAAGGKIAPKK